MSNVKSTKNKIKTFIFFIRLLYNHGNGNSVTSVTFLPSSLKTKNKTRIKAIFDSYLNTNIFIMQMPLRGVERIIQHHTTRTYPNPHPQQKHHRKRRRKNTLKKILPKILILLRCELFYFFL
jgi:hypothetical protein